MQACKDDGADNTDAIKREELIQELYRDRELLLADPHYIRQALQKYIVNILVDDEVVEINAVSEYLANRAIPGGLYACRGFETVNTAGCGSPQHGVLTYKYARKSLSA